LVVTRSLFFVKATAVKTSFPAIALLAIFSAIGLIRAGPPNQNKTASANPTSSKKDVVHLTPHSDSEARQIFTYFPYPAIPAQYRFATISGTALYRLTVDPQGNVTEIKIVKKMGVFGDWPADVTALKTFIHWRAKPGPTRIVDIPWQINPGHRYITNEGSHIPRH
jgi:TonB family protein